MTRVLVVDDEPDNRELLSLVLGWEGFEVSTAGSGAEALAAMAVRAPDIVLLDIMMPGMNGYEVVAQIRSMPAIATVPILMVTALEDEHSRARATAAGADGLVKKPLDRAALVAHVRRLLAAAPKKLDDKP